MSVQRRDQNAGTHASDSRSPGICPTRLSN